MNSVRKLGGVKHWLDIQISSSIQCTLLTTGNIQIVHFKPTIFESGDLTQCNINRTQTALGSADLDTSFLTLEKVHSTWNQRKSPSTSASIFTVFASPAFECAFAHPILFLSYLSKISMDCVSLICKSAMKCYLMCMCTSWLCKCPLSINTFSSPEAALILVSNKNRDLWEGLALDIHDSQPSHHSVHAQSQVWLWQIFLAENMKWLLCACSEN